MAKKIAILNHKGGVGKTTTAVNLAACICELGKKVLVIDLDPQGNASFILGFDEDKDEGPTVFDAMLDKMYSTPLPCYEYEYRKGLDLCPATKRMTEASKELNDRVRKEEILTKLVKPYENEYDYIIMDCRPELGILTINAMCCANSIIVPIDRPLSLKGMGDVLQKIEEIKIDVNPELKIEGFLINNYNSRLNIVGEIIEAVKELDVAPLFNARIHHIEKLSEMATYKKTIIDIDTRSTASDNFRQLAREITGIRKRVG